MMQSADIDPRIRAGMRAQAPGRQKLAAEGATRLGWKAGFGTAAAMANLGTTTPLVGYMTDATLLPSDAVVDVSRWGAPVLEPEVAVRLGRDLPAGADIGAAAGAIEAIAPAIELVDLGEAGGDVEAILAANIFHRRVLLGDFSPSGEIVRLDDIRIDVHAAERPHALQANPADLLGDLADVVRNLADALPAADDHLRAGDIVITGSAIAALHVSPGDRVLVRIADAQVSVTIA